MFFTRKNFSTPLARTKFFLLADGFCCDVPLWSVIGRASARCKSCSIRRAACNLTRCCNIILFFLFKNKKHERLSNCRRNQHNDMFFFIISLARPRLSFGTARPSHIIARPRVTYLFAHTKPPNNKTHCSLFSHKPLVITIASTARATPTVAPDSLSFPLALLLAALASV